MTGYENGILESGSRARAGRVLPPCETHYYIKDMGSGPFLKELSVNTVDDSGQSSWSIVKYYQCIPKVSWPTHILQLLTNSSK